MKDLHKIPLRGLPYHRRPPRLTAVKNERIKTDLRALSSFKTPRREKAAKFHPPPPSPLLPISSPPTHPPPPNPPHPPVSTSGEESRGKGGGKSSWIRNKASGIPGSPHDQSSVIPESSGSQLQLDRGQLPGDLLDRTITVNVAAVLAQWRPQSCSKLSAASVTRGKEHGQSGLRNRSAQ